MSFWNLHSTWKKKGGRILVKYLKRKQDRGRGCDSQKNSTHVHVHTHTHLYRTCYQLENVIQFGELWFTVFFISSVKWRIVIMPLQKGREFHSSIYVMTFFLKTYTEQSVILRHSHRSTSPHLCLASLYLLLPLPVPNLVSELLPLLSLPSCHLESILHTIAKKVFHSKEIIFKF